MIKSGDVITLSLQEAVVSAKEQLNIERTIEWDNTLERYANEALRQLDSIQSYIKHTKHVNVTDGRICLPNGFQKMRALYFPCNENTVTDQSGFYPYEFIYLDTDYQNWGGIHLATGNYSWFNTFQIIGDYVVFSCPTDWDDGTELIMVYDGINVDDDGLMVMYDYQERSIIAYICWKFSQKFPNQYTAGLRDEWRREWVAQKTFCKGYAVQQDFRNNKIMINSIFNAWITTHRQK